MSNFNNSLKSATRGALHNPFRTYSNFIYPKTIDEVLIWALWFWDRNAKYRSAIQKVVAYFISDINVSMEDEGKPDPQLIDKFSTLIDENYHLLQFTLDVGIELAALGNVFISAEPVISRELLCPTEGCAYMSKIKSMRMGTDYKWDGKNIVGTCPECGKQVKFIIKDVPTTDSDGRRVRFVTRDTRDMHLQYNRLTGSYKYLYKLPADIKDGIRRGDAVYLEDTPKIFLDAASSDSYVEFPPDRFFSMRTSTLSSLDSLYKGWGVPLFMTSFDNFIRLQHLDKFNEAITMDYIAPTRILSPQPANLQAGTDPNRMPLSGATFRNFVQSALKKVKENPTTWIVSPVPINYQMIGGEAKQLAPVDLMEWYVTQILSDMGIPTEFRMTSVQIVAPSMGLRMFERQWRPFATDLGKFVTWATGIVADVHNIDNVKCSLSSTSFVEDDNNKNTLIQLMMGGAISKTETLKRLGVDYKEDLEMQAREQLSQAEVQGKVQLQMDHIGAMQQTIPPAGYAAIQAVQAAQQQGAPQEGAAPAGGASPAQGGAPMPPQGMPTAGTDPAATIEQQFQQAQQIAQELYAAPPNIRRQQLVNMKATNPTLHAQVKQMLTDMTQQVASDAVAQSRQPQG